MRKAIIITSILMCLLLVSGCNKNEKVVNDNLDNLGSIYETKINNLKLTEKNILDIDEELKIDINKNELNNYIDINTIVANIEYDTIYKVKDTEQYFYKIEYSTKVIVFDNYKFYEISKFNDKTYIVSFNLSLEIKPTTYSGELKETNIQYMLDGYGDNGIAYYGMLNDSSVKVPINATQFDYSLNMFKEYMQTNNLTQEQFIDLFEFNKIYSGLFLYKGTTQTYVKLLIQKVNIEDKETENLVSRNCYVIDKNTLLCVKSM